MFTVYCLTFVLLNFAVVLKQLFVQLHASFRVKERKHPKRSPFREGNGGRGPTLFRSNFSKFNLIRSGFAF